MAIPISYNIRNLKLRKGLTIMTALGIALNPAGTEMAGNPVAALSWHVVPACGSLMRTGLRRIVG